MAFIDGRGSRFRISDTGGVVRDLSAYITEVRGLPGGRALTEVTALGDSGGRFKPGTETVRFALSGMFDDTADIGADAVLGALRYHDAPTTFEYAPAGFSTGSVRYTGECWVKSYELLSRAGEPVSWKAALQVEGAANRMTVTDDAEVASYE